ncbi:MAG: response regulator transcription factor [Ktedonobacterales bacterium]
MSQIDVALVDRQRSFSDALAARVAMEPGMRVVAVANSATTARRLLVGRHVDVLLLDSELPESLQLAIELTRHPRSVRVIMLGRVPEATRILDAVRAGITGWVLKSDSTQHLFAVILGVIRGEVWLPPIAVGLVLRLLLRERDEQGKPQEQPLASLTPREREVLRYLAKGFGRREVAERLHLSPNTIRSHLQNLMTKLDVHSSLEAIALARRAGLLPRAIAAVEFAHDDKVESFSAVPPGENSAGYEP